MSKIVLGPSSISQARSPSYTAHLKTDRQADRDRQTHTCLGPLPRGADLTGSAWVDQSIFSFRNFAKGVVLEENSWVQGSFACRSTS